MIFISLFKTKGKLTKENTGEFTKTLEAFDTAGIKILSMYWTLGRFDGVMPFEAPNEKEAMRFAIKMSEDATVQTMVAIPRKEALKLL